MSFFPSHYCSYHHTHILIEIASRFPFFWTVSFFFFSFFLVFFLGGRGSNLLPFFFFGLKTFNAPWKNISSLFSTNENMAVHSLMILLQVRSQAYFSWCWGQKCVLCFKVILAKIECSQNYAWKQIVSHRKWVISDFAYDNF